MSLAPNTKFMNVNSSRKAQITDLASRSAKLLEAGWAALELQERRQITQNRLCAYLGISPGTFINWTSRGTNLNQIDAILRLLERLPDSSRSALLSGFLRSFPIIESPEIAHEPTAASRLRALLSGRKGLTFIQGGGTDAARVFLFAALGHSLLQTSSHVAAIKGIDVHLPDWFVPVPGLAYLGSSANRAKLLGDIKKMWPKPNHTPWLMLNGVWSLVPGRHEEILSWCNQHHVVIADETSYEPAVLKKLCTGIQAPINILDLGDSDHRRIRVDFRAL